jgi:hypothetical protein
MIQRRLHCAVKQEAPLVGYAQAGSRHHVAPESCIFFTKVQHLSQGQQFLAEDGSIPPLPELPAAEEDQGVVVLS